MQAPVPFTVGLVVALLVTGCALRDRPLTPEDVMNSPEARLRSIILTNVVLRYATIDEAARYLTEQSRLADPDKVGLTITYRHFTLQDYPWRINLTMPQATVMQALDEACRQARCSYLVTKDQVTVLSEGDLKATGPPRRFDFAY